MQEQDLKTLSHLSQAFWADLNQGLSASRESLAAVSLKRLESNEALDRVAGALLYRANREGQKTNPQALNNPFYRLSAEERFVLSALHMGRFDYARLSKILDRTERQVAEIAWMTRLRMASATQTPHPTGSPYRGVYCPEYDGKNPWTQRFLDEEIEKPEQMFLQNHLMACGHCRAALNSCRDLYFAVEKLIPKVSEPKKLENTVRIFKNTLSLGDRYFRKEEASFGESIRRLLSHRDVQIVLAIFCVASLLKWFH